MTENLKAYRVRLPLTGYIEIEVEAESEAEAIENAMGKATIDDIAEWDVLDRINEGNVCYAMHPWEAEAEELEVDDHNV